VPTYRIYYAERAVGEKAGLRVPYYQYDHSAVRTGQDTLAATEWEEEVEAKDRVAALDAFFREHVRDRSDVKWVDDEGEGQLIEGVSDYNPDLTYIWIETNKLMEYQGLDKATPGLVCCPLCDGAGEVDTAVADEYLLEWNQDIEDR